MPVLKAATSLPFLFRAHNNFYSTLERLRRESKLCPLMEEGKIREKDLEASHFSPMVGQDGESTQLSLGYTSFEESWIDHRARESRQRKIQFVGHIALLTLILTTIYLIFYTQGFKA